MATKVFPKTHEGYVLALRAAADDIKRRAEEIVGDIEQQTRIDISISIVPGKTTNIKIIEIKKTLISGVDLGDEY